MVSNVIEVEPIILSAVVPPSDHLQITILTLMSNNDEFLLAGYRN